MSLSDPLRWSHLRHMARSPHHYRCAVEQPQPETRAMRLGAYVHHLVLGGDRLFAVYPGAARRGADWIKFQEDHADYTILTSSEADPCLALASVVTSDERAMSVLEGTREQTIRWHIGGRACEGTPDVLGLNYVSDLKLTNDANPNKLPHHARRMGWTAQLPWYGDGAIKNGVSIEHHYLVAVEAKWPFPPPVVYELEPNTVDEGRRFYRLLYERARTCEESGVFPGYAEYIVPIKPLDDDPDFSLMIEGEEVSLG